MVGFGFYSVLVLVKIISDELQGVYLFGMFGIGMRREVGICVKGVLFGGEENMQGLVVIFGEGFVGVYEVVVEVWLFFLVNFYVNEVLIYEFSDVSVFKVFFGYYMVLVVGVVFDIQYDWFVFLLGLCQGMFILVLLVYWLMGMLVEVGIDGVVEFIYIGINLVWGR